MRSRGLALGAALALAATGVAAVPASAAPSAPVPPGTTTFNTPGGAQIVAHLVGLIQDAETGSTIKFTAYRFEEGVVADALLDVARRKDVKVQLLVDGGAPETDHQQFKRVEQVLDEDGDDDTWARACRPVQGAPPYHSCQGTGSMHNKFVLFSKTGGAANVVSTGSANLNLTSGRNAWNSWYTHTGNADLYKRFSGYFDDMTRMRTVIDYYNENPPATTGNIKSYFYPRARVEGDLSANDTVVHTLEATTCPGTIRMANWSFSRSPVAEALVAKARQGCSVEIVARKIHEAACKPLAAAIKAGARVRMWSYEQGEGKAPNYVHSKDLLIQARYPGSAEAKVVFTGTGNLNRPSLEDNDENVVRIMDDSGVYARFVDNFNRIRTHVTASGQGFEITKAEDCDRAW